MEQEAAASAARQKYIQTEKQKYIGLIQAKVKRNWLKSSESEICVVSLRLGADGTVLDVLSANGNEAQCRAAVAALRKAEPLPVPQEPDVFDEFRSLRLPFDPSKP